MKPELLTVANREASKKDTDEYAEDTHQGVRQAEEPGRHLIHVALGRNPHPERERGHGRPPPACQEADDKTTKKQGGDDHGAKYWPHLRVLA